MKKFSEFKKEILRRAKEANACRDEYSRAYASNDFAELMQVIKDNFGFSAKHKIIDADMIKAYKDMFNENHIYCNVDVEDNDFLLACGNSTVTACGNSTVTACDNSTVEAYDNSTVKAYDNSTVTAHDNSTVTAWDNSIVKACDNSTVTAWGNSYIASYSVLECKLNDNAIYRIRESNTIRYCSDNIKFEKLN
jgi:alpha-tubulin suppressor-like RCC1 family protein